MSERLSAPVRNKQDSEEAGCGAPRLRDEARTFIGDKSAEGGLNWPDSCDLAHSKRFKGNTASLV